MESWYLYMIRCADGTLYTGITTDVSRRLAEHEAGTGAKRLRGRGALRVVLQKRIGTRSRALRMERWVKSLHRAEKESLIAHPEKLAPGRLP